MLKFQFKDREYRGATALEIIRAMEGETEDYPYRGQSIRQFLQWSLERLGDRLPPRDLGLSDRLEDDDLALGYLFLREEYGAGQLFINKTHIERSKR
jgi:hypothetical protein